VSGWTIDRIVHFDFGRDFIRGGLAHFGFHDSIKFVSISRTSFRLQNRARLKLLSVIYSQRANQLNASCLLLVSSVAV